MSRKMLGRLKAAVCFVFVFCFLVSPRLYSKRGIEMEEFGKTPEGEQVQIYTLTNAAGMEARIMTYGGIIVSLKTPDREGRLGDVVLGYDTLEKYIENNPYFGAIIGRYGNRIAKGRFTLNGKTYELAANNGPNHLHGGVKGFDKAVWSGEAFLNEKGAGLTLKYTSPDGEEGYPGKLDVEVTYLLTDENALEINYHAVTDKPTVVNLTNHSYFNLKDAGASPILNHKLTLNADRFTPVDETLIPTGELQAVEGTPFDFREPDKIGAGIDSGHPQLEAAGGYDHNFVLNREGDGLTLAARVHEPETGRVMEVRTTEPGVQFYSGNFLDGSHVGKGGVVYERRSGFCLETQHFPDSPNQEQFPPVTLNPGETYRSTTVYQFSAK